MDWHLVFTVITQNEVTGIKTNMDLGEFIMPAIVIILTIVTVILVSAILKVYLGSRKVTLEWKQFEDLIQRIQLTPEEASLVRTHLRKFRYSSPTDVLKKEGEFDRFYKKVLRRPNHHHDFILQMVRKKAFSGQLSSRTSSSPVKESSVNESPVKESSASHA